ncbi:hypothetical protein Desal_1942 [Maridesulfovibrio salexigens DSM 2638]|uniref:Uncharacterized protein n=1 Tax=Maridesulfovibrio salexigens (strain ATCC 14822 / DSM 2638 / NCIMB 8403 / VKM B-1763) TaxID=526222 RepID=C6BUJ3_MARSD|nr:hypothetical protein Desal_1942 [Maridesulfovibrio salexigens DSM 2638]
MNTYCLISGSKVDDENDYYHIVEIDTCDGLNRAR